MSEASGRHRWLLIAAAAAGLLAAAAGAATWILWFQPETRPAFTMTDLEGEERAISEWDGDLVVLNFWASWCRPCVEEIPVFTELQDDFGDQGLQMLGVAVDNRDAARDFSERLDMNYPSFQGTTSGMELVEAYERGRWEDLETGRGRPESPAATRSIAARRRPASFCFSGLTVRFIGSLRWSQSRFLP